MKIQEIEISKLNPSAYNPRKISEKEMKKLIKSINEYGFVEPVIVNKDMSIIGGHQRVKALTEIGKVVCPCVVVDLSKKKEKALNIALNKISGEFDVPKLKDLLRELDTLDFDMDLTGFDRVELDKLIGEKEKQKPELEFTEELLEEHNYLVLYFDNAADWMTACEKFKIKSVKALDSREGYERAGVGRILRGAEVLQRLND